MSQRRPLVLTNELMEVGKTTTIIEVRKRCPVYVDAEDVWQEICLMLISSSPQFDPNRGASESTFLKLIVSRAVGKYADKVFRNAKRFRPFEESEYEESPGKEPLPEKVDWFQYIECDETRKFCELLVECKLNKSEVARRLGWNESKVRYRFDLIKPRLLAAGFNLNKVLEEME
jgi:DNA-directed RNA polymerase specialized sigma24 family protein